MKHCNIQYNYNVYITMYYNPPVYNNNRSEPFTLLVLYLYMFTKRTSVCRVVPTPSLQMELTFGTQERWCSVLILKC